MKNPLANAADVGSTPGLGRSPGEGNGNQLQYSHLVNPMDRGAWQAAVHGVCEESDRTEHVHGCPQFKALEKWGVGRRFQREGIYVYIRLIHFAEQQKLTQHCKTTILQYTEINK